MTIEQLTVIRNTVKALFKLFILEILLVVIGTIVFAFLFKHTPFTYFLFGALNGFIAQRIIFIIAIIKAQK